MPASAERACSLLRFFMQRMLFAVLTILLHFQLHLNQLLVAS
jgi:hypothetical protein